MAELTREMFKQLDGVYFTNAEFKQHIAEHQQQLAAVAKERDTARRETWEAAATMLDEEEILESPDELDPRCKCQCFGILGRFSKMFREQAQAQP